MPGALVLIDHPDDLPILGHAIMGRHLRSRVGHPLYGGCCISHAGIMQHQHRDWQLPLIEIGRGRVDHTESLGNGIWPALRMVTMRSEEHTSELQSLMRISYAVFCLQQKNKTQNRTLHNDN